MRESRVIALSGVFQAATLVHCLARDGRCDMAAAESSLASVFRIDSDSAAEVFGGLSGIRLGMEVLVSSLDGNQRGPAVSRLVIGLMRLERKLAARAEMREQLRQGLESIQRQVDHLGITHATVQSRLAELYSHTLSRLRPRIMVHGNPAQLADPARVDHYG